ncbi:Beta-1,2-xylosyltransferase-like protein [Drosera capensis]
MAASTAAIAGINRLLSTKSTAATATSLSCHLPMKLQVFLLLLLNFLFLFTYLTSHPTTTTTPLSLHLHLHHHTQMTLLPSSLKPWPTSLPSYLPWLHNKPKPFSCEAFFGNGFTRIVDLMPRGGGESWFLCRYSETLRSSVCEGGGVRMDVGKVRMSRGGERVEDVSGRRDEEELPGFEEGAFRVLGRGGGRRRRKRMLVGEEVLDEVVAEGRVGMHTMRELVKGIEVVGEEEFDCDQWIEEPTLLLTRFEYANVFHTYTDWYSAYVSSRVTGLPRRPLVVFLDGHATTGLEETWEALFSSYRFAKNCTGSVCFRHAIFVPLGYETALFKGLTETIDCHGAPAHQLWKNPDDRKTARLSEFGEMITAAFGFPVDKPRTPDPTADINILFIRREDYLAHPRHAGKVESRLSNEQEVFDTLRRWVYSQSRCRLKLVNGLFAHMPMKEQLRAIQDASVIIGAHGAGLTHMLSASPNATILEIISSEYRRPHFRLIAQWKGLDYHAINLSGSYAKPAVIISRLKSILAKFGC